MSSLCCPDPRHAANSLQWSRKWHLFKERLEILTHDLRCSFLWEQRWVISGHHSQTSPRKKGTHYGKQDQPWYMGYPMLLNRYHNSHICTQRGTYIIFLRYMCSENVITAVGKSSPVLTHVTFLRCINKRLLWRTWRNGNLCALLVGM